MVVRWTEDSHRCACLRLEGDLDLYHAHELKPVGGPDPAPGDFVVDLGGTTYLDSSGIGALLHLFFRMRRQGRGISFFGARGPIQRVLRLSRVDHVLPLARTRAEAEEAVMGGSVMDGGPSAVPVEGTHRGP